MQKIFLIGYVGRDPEERVTAGGKKVSSFPLGISFSKGGEKITVWYRINCWDGSYYPILSHIKKGNCVTVIGDLSPPTTYQDKNGDIKIDMTVTCHSVSFTPNSKPKEERHERDESIVDFGGI